MLQDHIPIEKQAHLGNILDNFRKDALATPDVSYLAIVKYKGHPQILLESGGDDAEKELLMAFFMKWALTRSTNDLQKPREIPA